MLAIYCRISKEKEEGKDRSIDDQRKTGIELADRLNLSYEVFVDEGISGTLPIDERPAFSKLLDEIEVNKFTHLYSYDQSRLERRPETRIGLIKILKTNDVKLFTAFGEIDLHNDEVEMLGDIRSIFDSYFVRQTKKKVKSVLRRRVEQGKAHSSILPYGYKKDINGYLAIDNEESEIVKRLYDLSLNGTGTNKIAEIFNNECIQTRYNKLGEGTITTVNKETQSKKIKLKKDIKWSGNTIYKGIRIYGGKEYKVDEILDEDYWQSVNDNLAKNRNNSGKVVIHKYLLKGVVSCGKCGRNMYGRTRISKKDNYYMCSSKRIKHENCKNRSINIDNFDTLIFELLEREEFGRMAAFKYLAKENVSELLIGLEKNLKEEEKIKKGLTNEGLNLLRLATKGIISDDVFASENDIISKKIKNSVVAIKSHKRGIENLKITTENITNTDWSDVVINELSFVRKKELIQDTIDRIWVFFDTNKRKYRIGVKYKLVPSRVFFYLVDYKCIFEGHATSCEAENDINEYIQNDDNFSFTIPWDISRSFWK